MVYQLLKRAIEQQNSFMTKDMIALQINFYFTLGKLTQAEFDELNELLNPTAEVTADNITE
jgi:hypothetical protein